MSSADKSSSGGAAQLGADIQVLWRLARGQPRAGEHAERLERFYAPQAERYDAFRARLLHGREDLIQALEIPDGARVVELGCGTGANLALLEPQRLASVQMVDLCPSLLAVARRRAEALPRLEVIEADATTWRPAQPADRVFISYALTMMPNWRAVLGNAQAMLAPGGRLGVVDFHLPAQGNAFGNGFWKTWFGHDGVKLSYQHPRALKSLFPAHRYSERRGAVPYLPLLRAPYYLFVGNKPDSGS